MRRASSSFFFFCLFSFALSERVNQLQIPSTFKSEALYRNCVKLMRSDETRPDDLFFGHCFKNYPTLAMSKAKGGFFDDDDDEDQLDTFNETSESYDTSNYGGGGAAAAAAGGPIEDSLSSTGYPSPPRRYQIGSSSSENGAAAAPRPGGGARASSITTAGRTGAAAAGSSTREYESTRGGSPTLDDILGTDGDVSNERNVQRLLRAWHNEMGAPELLTFPTRLVDRLVVDLSRRVC